MSVLGVMTSLLEKHLLKRIIKINLKRRNKNMEERMHELLKHRNDKEIHTTNLFEDKETT